MVAISVFPNPTPIPPLLRPGIQKLLTLVNPVSRSAMLYLVLFAISAFLAVYIYYKHSFQYWKRKNVPTYPPTFPFGNMFWVVFRFTSVNEKVCELYNEMKARGYKYAGLYFFSRKVFVLLDPYLIKCVLSKDFQYFNDRGIYYDEKNDPVSAHLFSLSGIKWKNLRSKLTPAFTAGKIKYMLGNIVSSGDEMTALIRSEIKVDNCVDIKDILARFTTDVIGSCAFGIECNSLRNPNAEFRQMGRRAFTQTPGDAFKMIVIRSFPQIARLLKMSVFTPAVSKFFKNVVEDTINYRENHNITRQDFLQLLIQLKNNGKLDGDSAIQDGTALTMNEAAAQAFIFFLAGFETTSTTISFALLEMALNVSIQDRARDELKDALARHHDEWSYELISELHYLETVVLESLRKYPPAPVFLRKCTKDYTIPGTDVVIEKGQSTLIPAMAVHRDPAFYPDPELFDPDRFAAENKSRIKDDTYFPFGDGPRICIGMRFAMVQSKLALAQILRSFKFGINPKTKLPLRMETKGIVLTPIGGIWLEFTEI